jgi:hypothetical protein
MKKMVKEAFEKTKEEKDSFALKEVSSKIR